MQIYTNFESNSQPIQSMDGFERVVSDANIHKFWKQFTTIPTNYYKFVMLFLMQIYTNFESNSQRMEHQP